MWIDVSEVSASGVCLAIDSFLLELELNKVEFCSDKPVFETIEFSLDTSAPCLVTSIFAWLGAVFKVVEPLWIS